jgi:hypothetical protein
MTLVEKLGEPRGKTSFSPDRHPKAPTAVLASAALAAARPA